MGLDVREGRATVPSYLHPHPFLRLLHAARHHPLPARQPRPISRKPPLTGPASTSRAWSRPSRTSHTTLRPPLSRTAAAGSRNRGGPVAASRRAGRPSRGRQEVHPRAHLGQDARIVVQDAHLHLHRRALAVGGGHHLAHLAAERRVRIGVERDPRRLPMAHARDVRLVHVHLDLERGEVGHRHDRAAREPAAHRRRHHLADLGFLPEHGAGERRADVRVLERRLARSGAPPAAASTRAWADRAARVPPASARLGAISASCSETARDCCAVDLGDAAGVARASGRARRRLDELRAGAGEVRLAPARRRPRSRRCRAGRSPRPAARRSRHPPSSEASGRGSWRRRTACVRATT